GVLGGMMRNDEQKTAGWGTVPNYPTVNAEYAAFAAAQNRNCRPSVRASLKAGLRNGMFKNGLTYTYQATIIAFATAYAAIESGTKYVADLGRAIAREEKGETPCTAASQTFANYFSSRMEKMLGFLEQKGLLLIPVERDKREVHRHISGIVTATQNQLSA